MLQLKNITKTYGNDDRKVQALKGINVEFRENEFVSILGPSGCGKTTLLNIIGGLDQYTTGDLIINGTSTKEFRDRDWDTYRNHSIGFVFQNYNLISHQSVLANVELALTLAGIGKRERRKRAITALKEVGLEEQIHKKPNQLSGGQMQRVAIARALVGNPDILLADEPTGALDTVTSVQIMELLKKIAKDRLVIMVTHNPDLADKYSTRIVKLLDGKITDDSNPYKAEKEEIEKSKEKQKNIKKTHMSFFTALSLSLNNLLTKKGRTFLTAFAGSIGIIGIAAILSLSNGVQKYIEKVQEDTLSSYPLVIEKSSIDMTTMMQTMMGQMEDDGGEHEENTVKSRNIMMDLMNSLTAERTENNLEEFKKYIDSDDSNIKNNSSAIKYSYDLNLNIYKEEDNGEYKKVNPSQIIETFYGKNTMMTSSSNMMMSYSGDQIWEELLDNEELLNSQFEVLAGRFPEKYDEIVIKVDKNNTISDYALYSLGLRDSNEFLIAYRNLMSGKAVDEVEEITYTFDELLGLKYKVLLNTEYFQKEGNIWLDKSSDTKYINDKLDNAIELKVVGIIKENDEATATSLNGNVGYTHDLTEYVINEINKTDIAKEQLANENINVFTGREFSNNKMDYDDLTDEQKQYISTLSQEELAQFMTTLTENSTSTYEENLRILGIAQLDIPFTISIYPKDFESKNAICDEIEAYNRKMVDNGREEDKITYTDYIGIMLNAVTSIVHMISYVLIGFVAISLIVSSIMIGIITYISVLERIKEIGILRAIGASKKDISRVFNAETFIVGVLAGAVGIGITLLILIPANIIIKMAANVSNLAKLPFWGAIGLIVISMILTVIAGLIPAKIAAKKDPVEALRTE